MKTRSAFPAASGIFAAKSFTVAAAASVRRSVKLSAVGTETMVASGWDDIRNLRSGFRDAETGSQYSSARSAVSTSRLRARFPRSRLAAVDPAREELEHRGLPRVSKELVEAASYAHGIEQERDLRGERLEELDVEVGERPPFPSSVHVDGSEHLAVRRSRQRNADERRPFLVRSPDLVLGGHHGGP